MNERPNPCKDCDTRSCESYLNENSECWQPNATLQVLASGIRNGKEFLQSMTGQQLENQRNDDHPRVQK